MCQSLNQHIFFLWWLASLLFIVTLTNYLSLYKVWCWKRKKIYFGSCNPQSLPLILGPAFLSNILSTTASDNSWWLFSYILHELSILLPKAFLTFSAFWKLLSWHYIDVSLSRFRFCENFTSIQFFQHFSWRHAICHIF